MKKLLIIMIMVLGPLVSMAEEEGFKGEQVLYDAEVTCPDGRIITIVAKCCEPGGDHNCGYISCANYHAPTVNCAPE